MIRVEELVYQYPKNDTPTLKGLSFEIDKGEVFGFLGPSGSGKSTAQKILYKVLGGYGGDIRIDDKALEQWDQSYFEKIGVGFELPNHYMKLTGRENMDLFSSFYPRQRKRELNTLFEMFDLQDAADKPVEAYSKGMKMRLNFIRAIQHDPDILFFDEPTSGLDPINAHRIKQYIRQLKKEGKTIFLTTHSMETADEICDRVSFIAEGKLLATDQPSRLKEQYGKKAVTVQSNDGETMEFPLLGLGDNPAFLQFIQSKDVKRIHTMEATLEEVFIKITGKRLTS